MRRAHRTRIVAGDRPDVVLAYCSGMARFALEPPLDGLPFVLDMVDVDSAKWARRLARQRVGPDALDLSRARRARWARSKRAAARRAQATLVVNEREREPCSRSRRTPTCDVVPNGVDLDAFAPPQDRRRRSPIVVFCGVMDYEPNADGVALVRVRGLAARACATARRRASSWSAAARPPAVSRPWPRATVDHRHRPRGPRAAVPLERRGVGRAAAGRARACRTRCSRRSPPACRRS